SRESGTAGSEYVSGCGIMAAPWCLHWPIRSRVNRAAESIALYASQRPAHFRGGLAAAGRVLVEERARPTVDGARRRRTESGDARRIAVEHLEDRARRRRRGKRRSTERHLVEDRAEREQIAAVIERRPQNAFGRDVACGAEHLLGGALRSGRRQPEVEDLDA